MPTLTRGCRCHTDNLEMDDDEQIYLLMRGWRCRLGGLHDLETVRSECPQEIWHEVDELGELARGEFHGDPGLLLAR